MRESYVMHDALRDSQTRALKMLPAASDTLMPLLMPRPPRDAML